MRVAIEGCGHGTLHAIYASIKQSCRINHWDGVDLLIIGGDFQAVRNSYDLNTMSVPQKFRAIGDFHEYYSGARKAPYPTIFVGGNHEASSHLQELYYGGWVAPNIYYLGAANVIRFGDLRIAGLSGIWKGYNYNKPHFERLPYDENEVKSLYHVREIDVRKLLLLRTQVDIGISHDWPRGVEWQGDWKSLFKKKDLFEADARAGTLGSSAAKYVMDRLRPPYWFSAHLHCKFAAVIDHDGNVQEEAPKARTSHEEIAGLKNADEIDINRADGNVQEPSRSGPAVSTKNTDEIEIDLDMDDEELIDCTTMPAVTPTNKPDPQTPSKQSEIPSSIRSQLPAAFTRPPTPPRSKPQPLPPPPSITNNRTHFLALDKCLPHRKFLQILDILPLSTSPTTTTTPPQLTYDKEWLAILRVFSPHDPHSPFPQDIGEAAYRPLIEKEEEWVEENVVKMGKMTIPENFAQTAPGYDGKAIGSVGREQPLEYSNPQTGAFCQLVGLRNFFDEEEGREERRREKVVRNEEVRRGGGGGGVGRGGRRGGGRGRGRGRGQR
ncbi:lariat debranching enzyme [Lecanora helva]